MATAASDLARTVPDPSAGEVRCRDKAIGPNRAEVMFGIGGSPADTKLSSKLGYKAYGIVEANAYGAITIGAARSSKKKANLLVAGADYVIAVQEEDLAARLSEIGSGKGVRIVFDPMGGQGLDVLTAAGMGIIFEYGALTDDALPSSPLLSRTR
jgi:NADPH:quinone reductase-like Zn-dependent oxidoreductase